MNIKVPLEAKKVFLGWFLDRHQLKRRESMWILNYFLNHDIVLNKVHFVESVDTTPRGMMMSSVGTDNEPFFFYKDGTLFNDPEQAFHEVRLNWHEDIYVELIFRDPWKSPQYLAVLEDNPYHKWNDFVSLELKKEVEHALAALSLSEQKQQIMNQVDEALEAGDREGFIQLSNDLKEIEEALIKEQKKPNH
ncbi:YpiB family protein [Carnobacterium sp. CS13]|uniref:ReoY family proteolytic degradation factor n=1 Tax=Carnobacterium sp. CS13 TaxID=2800128 RepID=UPI0019134042|nr:ReoY family proteolytic degradation factor [Carnobacterium sp. CS13]QQP71154.1 YpiB family protein [Carnobacterium sp. CS13]